MGDIKLSFGEFINMEVDISNMKLWKGDRATEELKYCATEIHGEKTTCYSLLVLLEEGLEVAICWYT